jgi:hypothetical protein
VISLVQAAIIGEFSSLSSTRPGWPGYASACFRSSAHTLSSLLILVTELGLFLAFTSAQMLLYLCVPQLLLATGATFLNLSLLTSDFFAVAIGTLLFGDEVPGIYAAAFACTVGGLVVFHLSQLSNLVHFDYYGNYAGAEGLYAMCKSLAHTPRLQHLDLGCNYLNHESVHFVVYALSNLTQLRSLHLAAPPALTPMEHRASITLGDVGLQVLCKGIAATVAHKNISRLSLEGAGAGAAGIEAIANCISGMRSLVHLNISHNAVTPQCSSVLAAALGRLENMVALNMDGCFECVHGTQDMCLNVLSCIYAMPLLRSFSCGFNLEEVDMRLMLGHLPHQTTTHLSLGLPLPREYVTCHIRQFFYSFYSPFHRYICSRLPAYQNLQSLTWCITSLTEKQQTSFVKSLVALFENGLSVLTLFCDSRSELPPDASAADIKKYHEVSSFPIKGIVAAAATAKALKEINFVRLSLQPHCVSAVLQAPASVQQCLKFLGMFIS